LPAEDHAILLPTWDEPRPAWSRPVKEKRQ
jgi:hypothetical protein